MIGEIKLTQDEQAIAKEINFATSETRLSYEDTHANGERIAALFESLCLRNAIPENRIRYFSDPDYNPKNTRASRKELFLRNIHTPADMLRHPHFVKYLRYFIYGANLPLALKAEFQAQAKDGETKPLQLAAFAGSLVRKYDLPRHPQNIDLNNAFYQLALDCGCREDIARSVRQAVMKVK